MESKEWKEICETEKSTGCPSSLFTISKIYHKANEETDKWKLLRNETYIFKFFFTLFNTPLYMSTTKHIETLLDFLHDRCFLQMFVPVTINFLCHARIDGRNGGSLPYVVLKH